MAYPPDNATAQNSGFGRPVPARPAEVRSGRSGRPRSDPFRKSMLLGLIEDSYLSAGTFTQFAAEVLEVLVYAITVPMAFTEGFVKSYLSIDRIVEADDGRITIIPRKTAELEDVVRDSDEILAKVDGGAVYDPVVRSRLENAHQVSRASMRWDIDELAAMDDEQLMGVLREMQAESERARLEGQDQREATTDHIRARIATIRRNVRQYSAPDDHA